MSGLPSGYTQLEYIESSGTQYIDTGIVASSGFEVEIKLKANSFNNLCSIIGAHNDSSPYGRNYLGITSSHTEIGQCDSVHTYTAIDTDSLHVVLCSNVYNNMYFIVDNVAQSTSGAQSGGSYAKNTLYLFWCHGGAQWFSRFSGRIYYCKITESGTLVRDFIPCKNASGAVGLYDLMGAKFYTNAGSGTFTAGPEISYEPATPTNFTASVSGQTVALSWAAAANAIGYRLKRDGVQIAEQTGTTYTDTVPDEIALCTYTLTAYNDDGESAAAALTVILRLDLITDRTRADVANQTDKGFYNASDLNRVGAAVEYIAGRFTALGYACPVTVKKDWLTTDAPTASQMEAYRQNIVTLRSQIAVMVSTPEAPASMAGLNYIKANDIEQILADMDFILQNMPAAFRHCGVTVCGSKGVIA